LATTGSAPWRTRIAAFKFPNRGATPPAPPTPPTGLTATAASASQINLAWTDNSANEDGFKIERCTDADRTTFSQIAAVQHSFREGAAGGPVGGAAQPPAPFTFSLPALYGVAAAHNERLARRLARER
jgi:hypothetical protein